MKVSIVVPARNEERNIGVMLDELVHVLEAELSDYEVVIVNDNSSDGTPAIIDNIAYKNPRIKPVHRHSDPGFGNSIREGIKNATGDIIILMRANLSDDPQDVTKLVRKIEEGCDIAYGSRFMEGGTTEGYPQARKVANRAFNSMVRLLFGIKHKDVTNVFKAYRREVLDSIGIEGLDANGYSLAVEMPLKAHIMGFTSEEVPVKWHGREEEDDFKLSENALLYVKHLLKLFFVGNIISLKDLLGSVSSGSKLKQLGALIFGLLVLIGIFKFSGYSQVYETIKNISLIYVFIGFAAISLAFIMRTWRWRVLLRVSGYVVPSDIIFKSLMFGFFLNVFIPARAGDIARGAVLKTIEKIPMGISLSTIVIERAMDMLTLALLLGLGAMLVSRSNIVLTIAIAASLSIAFLLVLMLFLVYKYEKFISRKLEKRFPAVSGFLNAMKEGLSKIYYNPAALILSIAISLPVWLFEISGVYLAAMAIGYKISFSLSIVAGIISFLGQTIPITPAGIGVYEGTMVGALVLFGIPPAKGISLALVDHIVRVLVTLIFGMISMIHLGFASRAYFMEKKEQKVKSTPIKDIRAD